MPWTVKPLKGKFCVIKKGEFIPIKDGCFDTKDEAAAKVRALYGSDAEMAIAESLAEFGHDHGDYVAKPGLPPQHVETMGFVANSLKELSDVVMSEHFSPAQVPTDQAPAAAPMPAYKSYDEYMEELTASGKEIVEHAWEGPIAFEGVFTGDKRFFRPGSIEWNAESFPVPFRWQKSSVQGHTGAVPVGRVDHLERKDDGTIYGYGVIIPSLNEEAAEYLRLLESGVGSGVSVDGDSAVFDVKELADGTTSVEFSSMRIRSLTAVDIPAFDQAQVDLVTEDDKTESLGRKDALRWAYSLTAAAGAPVKPPIEWFEDPKLGEPTPIKINPQGEIFGHLALFDSCHIGFPGSCVSPPKNGTYKYFHTGELETDKGDLVEVGHLTFNTGHAAMTDTAKSAAAHYDHTGTVAADVRVGEDKFGIWVAGALRSHLGDEDVRAFRAAPLSGDWRRIAGRLELVGALAVNVPGFPVPRVRTLVASGETETLITFQEAEVLARQDQKDELGQRVLAFQLRASQDKKNELAQRMTLIDPELEEFFNKHHGRGGLFTSRGGGGGGAPLKAAPQGDGGKTVKLGTIKKVHVDKLSDGDLKIYQKKAKSSSTRWAVAAAVVVGLDVAASSKVKGGLSRPHITPLNVLTVGMALGRKNQQHKAEAELTKRKIAFALAIDTLSALNLESFDFDTYELGSENVELAVSEEQMQEIVGDPVPLTVASAKEGLAAISAILADDDEDLTPEQASALKDIQAQLETFLGHAAPADKKAEMAQRVSSFGDSNEEPREFGHASKAVRYRLEKEDEPV